MKYIQQTAKRFLIGFMVLIQLVGYGAFSFGGSVAADDPACPVTTGTQSPTGSSAIMYTFNPATCLWESAYYSWSPVTKAYTPKYDPGPTYNPTTNSWDYISWDFVSSEGAYIMHTTSVPATIPEQIAQGDAPPTTTATIDNGNGTDSNNTITNSPTTDATINNTSTASILTGLNSTATTGNANATFNTTVGNVGTGDATTVANVLNMIQSGWDPSNGDIRLFSADLYNNYYGDILFDPSVILGNGTNSNNIIAGNAQNNLTINNTDDASIQNDINLDAQSGSATANGNTTVGIVSTGDANALANVINMINSSIDSGESFLGSINLYGDLNGDILLPQALRDIMLGNGTNSSNAITDNSNTNVNANNTTNTSIATNTDLNAQSGLAVANNNTTAGDISTGDANTNVNQMNLVGQSIQGSKGLLVFVNVLGNWVGMLFNTPGNATINAGNGTNSNNAISDNANTNIDLNNTQNFSIINNLNLNARSGDATANNNTTVGNVTTGDATSSANILNMINSHMQFNDWFGVLFINVFGSWNGSFGINTAAGNALAPVVTQNNAAPVTDGGSNAGPTTTSAPFISFVPKTDPLVGDNEIKTGAVLASAHTNGKPSAKPVITTPAAAPSHGLSSSFIWSASGIAFAMLLFGLERYLTLFRKH